MFKSEKSSKNCFLQQIKDARAGRAVEKDRENAARCIQKCIRKWLDHIHFTAQVLEKFESSFSNNNTDNEDMFEDLKPSIQMHELLVGFMTIYKKERDKARLEIICKYLVRSLDSETPKFSYIGVALTKDRYFSWKSQLKKLLHVCLTELEDYCPDLSKNYKSILIRLHTLVSFTSTNTWAIMKTPEMEKLKVGMNQLCVNITGYLVKCGFYRIMQNLLLSGICKNINTVQPVILSAIITLTMRPLIYSKMSEILISEYIVRILSVPSLLHHLNKKDHAACILSFRQQQLFLKCIVYLNSKVILKDIFNTLRGNYTLCLLANLVELGNIECKTISNESYSSQFIFVVTNLLEQCQEYVVAKKSNTTYWHPILGWFEQPEDELLQQAIPIIKFQLSYLWTGNIISELFYKPLNELVERQYEMNNSHAATSTNRFYKIFVGARTNKNFNNKRYNKICSPEMQKIILICSLYQTALCTLKEIKSTILTGLCYKDRNILHNLWLFLGTLGPFCGLKTFLSFLTTNVDFISPEFKTLILFCDCMTHYITILDDIEMYEKQDPFKLSDFVSMSYFLNQFLYKLIINDSVDTKQLANCSLFISLHALLMAIYRRDCQNTFCSSDHWLIKEVRLSGFLTDLDRSKPVAIFLLSKMPHILPHYDRVVLFRKRISEEKAKLGLLENTSNNTSATLIAVHRSRIIEDGYRQLSMLPPKALKGVIRVRFINEQGVDEAGIDQDGVFKEFLEETIKKVFDPSLNLFKTTSENRLYPSSTSFMQDNHLLLFEFVGRMLGKAVYEGIVVDVPFASFFISQFCGQAGGIFYSCLDELASLDQELYRNLTMVKHHKGDVSLLELTFSLDEYVMGKLVTYELKPGGKVLPVTNDCKINYIHLMARFRIHDQIKEQIAAFTKGFRSIINPDWLSLFSTPEWQRLISGDNAPLDLRDLRKHTQYYGGFHDKHRVISWLWEILEKDFTESERGLFLKFVTSCSKSPLLGFVHLEPPFSIRCIEVSDDEDTGDTIGSVLRGFFTIRKKDPQNRLPTSSTCFNLLKLPNYKRKSTLREKLHYAISSSTGFELS